MAPNDEDGIEAVLPVCYGSRKASAAFRYDFSSMARLNAVP
jgi:hypothetical protein